MKITLLYQVAQYIRVKKQRNIKSWDQQNHLVIRGFCYIRPLYNEVPLYHHFESSEEKKNLCGFEVVLILLFVHSSFPLSNLSRTGEP